MNPSLEFCALRYLLLWHQTDSRLHDAMKAEPHVGDLRAALHNYGVARTFKGIKDHAKASCALQALREIDNQPGLSPVEKVEFLMGQFATHFERANLSAATKLLWLRYRSPFVILDARACTALVELKQKFDKRSYAEYFDAWNAAFNQQKERVIAAADQLATVQPFFAAWHPTPTSVLDLVRQPWFLERIFDIYLWEKGA